MNVVRSIGISYINQKLVSRSRPQIRKIMSWDQGKGVKLDPNTHRLFIYIISQPS